jgi:dTDP-4-amino-4,6-dideoxygalactose transaminase
MPNSKRVMTSAKAASSWERYNESLSAWAQQNGRALAVHSGALRAAHHMFYVLLPSLEERSRLIAHLKAKSILAVFHYLPLHASPMGERFGGNSAIVP